MNNRQAFETQLEIMIDTWGLDVVVDTLSSICHEKAEHLRANWQDVISAHTWDKRAAKLSRVSEGL